MSSRPPEPARGAQAGIKGDIARAKAKGEAYDPRGHGNAYTHNFLNQKPWHPMNFRNQIKKYEVEQQAIADAKTREEGLAEFAAEQEYMQTLSYLSEAEKQKYKDRQSISFMYTKPPGLDAALAKEQAVAVVPAGAAAAPGAGGGGGGGKDGRPQLTPEEHEEMANRARDLDRVREDPFAVMLQARAALQNKDNRLEITVGAGNSPAHGGFTHDAVNQMLLAPEQGGPGPAGRTHDLAGVVADAADLAMLASMNEEERSAVLRRLRKMQKETERLQQLDQAKALLLAAGYDVGALTAAGQEAGTSSKRKHKHKKEKEKSKKKKKEKKSSKDKRSKSDKDSSRQRDSGSSDSSSESDRGRRR